MAVLRHSLVDVADETIDQFDRCQAQAYARAGHDLEEIRGSMAQATNEPESAVILERLIDERLP